MIISSGCRPREGRSNEEIAASQKYKKALSDFYISLAAEQTDKAFFAYNKMFEITKLYPEEPAVWADLGVFAYRQGSKKVAEKYLGKAEKLAPENGDIKFLQGLLKSYNGDIQAAVERIEKAASLSPDNPTILFALIKELEREGRAGNAGEIQHLFEKLQKLQPENMAVMVEEIQFYIDQGQVKKAGEYLQKLSGMQQNWPEEARKRLKKILNEVSSGKTSGLSTQIAFLDHDLRQIPDYQNELNTIQLQSSQIGYMITHFISLPNVKATSSPIDPDFSLKQESLNPGKISKANWIRTVSLKSDSIPHILVASGNKIHLDTGQTLTFPGKISEARDIAVLDYNYDFLNDLFFAGPDGIRMFRQEKYGQFKNVTSSLKLPASIIHGNYRAVWRADIDSDGDLDLILAPEQGNCFVLRNNGDGTFTKIPFFMQDSDISDFRWADLDNDGDPDAAILERSGRIKLFMNQRLGKFKSVSTPLPDSVLAFTIADVDEDAHLDLVILNRNGKITRLFYDHDDGNWKTQDLVKWHKMPRYSNRKNSRIFVQDMDNNGRLDIIASAGGKTQIWLGKPDGTFMPMRKEIQGTIYSLNDMNGNGRLDGIGMSDNHHPVEWISSGSSTYHGEVIRPRASGKLGDRRINSFGIGGVLEARAGLIYQQQPITTPLVHFGLGTYNRADLLRIIWPNGSVQAEFSELNRNSTLTNKQSLKGSCPWLFAYDGKKMNFVTDLLWRSPMGLRINAQKTASLGQPEDWVKVRGDQLKPRNGYYDLSVTAELWETHFFDYLSLMTVDHPENTHIFVDERFSFPPPKMKVYVTGPLHSLVHAWDEKGEEVTQLLSHRDGRYLAHFQLTKYQGLAKKHYITLDLGSHLPLTGPLWLIANGWVYPTDSSINVAISQGNLKAPQGFSVQIPDRRGGWKTVEKNLGFPEGKNKTMLINLEGLFHKRGDHKIRLVTSTQTYWDAIWWAKGLPDAKIITHRLLPYTAMLRYRGYSKLVQKSKYAPLVPDYQDIAGTTPKWSDLVGYYTRYGNVKPLLDKVDDRFVIMNAGDEMRLKFKDSSKPPKGWKRDFVVISNGWEKDGDYNTTFSKTVIPLPSHKHISYDTPPTTLQNDPVYKEHKQDWITYQTRYVTPQSFYNALLFGNKKSR